MIQIACLERWRKSTCGPEEQHEERVQQEKSDDHASRRPLNAGRLGNSPSGAAFSEPGKLRTKCPVYLKTESPALKLARTDRFPLTGNRRAQVQGKPIMTIKSS
jgi:hypothetical protein